MQQRAIKYVVIGGRRRFYATCDIPKSTAAATRIIAHADGILDPKIPKTNRRFMQIPSSQQRHRRVMLPCSSMNASEERERAALTAPKKGRERPLDNLHNTK